MEAPPTTVALAHSAPTIGKQEAAAVERVVRSGRIAQGAEVEAFEDECAAQVGRRFGVATSSGTAALHLSLAALSIEENEPVAVPSYACAALVTAVQLQRARAELCDVGADYLLAVNTIPKACSTAIVPHLFGATAAIPEGCSVIEDIAQSIGGATGRATELAVASFYATKLITTGEGGMVLTDSEGLAEFVRDRRDYDKRDDLEQRYAYKMTDMQAAMGRVQLGRLSQFIARRREIAAQYSEAFANLPLSLPGGVDHVYFRYVVSTEARNALAAHLESQGVQAVPPVYKPAHLCMPNQRATFAGSDTAHQQCLSIPIYPSLSDGDILRVIQSVQSFYQ